MEEYHHQLYRRPQMTGKAREEEEEELMYDKMNLSITY